MILLNRECAYCPKTFMINRSGLAACTGWVLLVPSRAGVEATPVTLEAVCAELDILIDMVLAGAECYLIGGIDLMGDPTSDRGRNVE
jgi:hypothetical protein